MIRRIAFALSLGLGLALGLLWLLGGQNGVALADPGILYVAPGGNCGGATPCYATVQAAVDAASTGDEIRVAAGAYTGVQNVPSLNTATFTATQMVAIIKSVTIQGGYTTSDWDTSDPTVNQTTLDAQGQGRVLYVTEDIAFTIEGLRITGGDAGGLGGTSWGSDAGGGVYVYAATVTIANCNVYSNSAHTGDWGNGYGGGLYLASSSHATLQGNTVSGNTASTFGHGYGGGLHLDQSHHATLKGNIISSNTGTTSANGRGGGLYLDGSDNATLDGNTISDNIGSQGANYYGGGLYLGWSDHAILTGNTIKGNTAGAAWSWGGGLYLASSNHATLTENTIEGNTASIYQGWGGGLYLDWGSDITLSRNVVISNAGTSNPSFSSWGGGVYIRRGGPFTLTNNVIVGNNVTTAGSGLYVEASDPHLLHTTIARNTGGDGSGVYITDDGEGNYSTVAMTNTIIVSHTVGITVTAGNTTTLNATVWHANSTDYGGNVLHTNDRSGDPAFDTDGYHLTSNSAAIDQGVDAGVTTDIDGDPRPMGKGYDIGADEFRQWYIYLPLVLSRG